jgi:hypothetical protein
MTTVAVIPALIISKPPLRRNERQLGAKAQFASPIGDFCNKICQKRARAFDRAQRGETSFLITGRPLSRRGSKATQEPQSI